MRSMFLALLLSMLPMLALGQSLAEVAKKEKERREKNKREGREVLVISESEIFGEEEEAGGGESGATSREAASGASSRVESAEEYYADDYEADEERVPQSIPPHLPLERKLELFERMKREYQRQAAEIDEQIADNNERLQELQDEIAETSALGGAGLPVAPKTGTGTATRPMTGQESASLVAEQNRLQNMNEGLRRRKEQLKNDLQAKGRTAGIPPGYLRF